MAQDNTVNISSKSIIRIAEVLELEDNLEVRGGQSLNTNSFGRRIKIKFAEHQVEHWAWPLLPKHLQVIPKVHENVLVFVSDLDGTEGNLFYVGPIISQDYYLNECPNKTALALLQGQGTKPLCHPQGNSENDGTYPDKNTIAIQGRGDAAMWLKDEELRLMCGHKSEWRQTSTKEGADPGNLKFNNKNLSYIQMKYAEFTYFEYNEKSKKNETKTFNSVIDIVADRIHLITHNGADSISDLKVTDNEDLMSNENELKFEMKGQRMVYGDELITFLEKFRKVFRDHTHHWANDPQVELSTDNADFWNKDLNNLLCNGIRIA
jgi:hypothetical protein